MARLLISAAAQEDLLRIYEWISEHNGEDRADLVLRRMNTSLERLAKFPNLAPPARSLDDEALRRHSVRPWTVFYRPLMEGGVEILRVFDSRRDLAALLGEKT
jgi:plasmid stabilization system protein ParE